MFQGEQLRDIPQLPRFAAVAYSMAGMISGFASKEEALC